MITKTDKHTHTHTLAQPLRADKSDEIDTRIKKQKVIHSKKIENIVTSKKDVTIHIINLMKVIEIIRSARGLKYAARGQHVARQMRYL
jgi:hypothetical protein